MFTKELGLKQVESEYDSVKKISTYKINNKKILLKGAGWTPDLFLRQSPENYYTHIKYVRDMGLNVIRLEGKSEGEEFYEYCDKMGILIISGWNCADAWQRWKYWDDSVIELSDLSVRSQIRKLSPHPSVIIFILGSDDYPKNGTDERWRQIFFEELVGEMKHVCHGDVRRSIGRECHVVTQQETVCPDDFARLGSPHQQLLAWFGHGVELVDVAVLSGSATRSTERDFAQSAYLTHGVRGTVGINYVDFVVGLVGASEPAFGREFLLYEFGFDGVDDVL